MKDDEWDEFFEDDNIRELKQIFQVSFWKIRDIVNFKNRKYLDSSTMAISPRANPL